MSYFLNYTNRGRLHYLIFAQLILRILYNMVSMSLILNSDRIIRPEGGNFKPSPKKVRKPSSPQKTTTAHRSNGESLARNPLKVKNPATEASPSSRVAEYKQIKAKHRKTGLGGEILFARALKKMDLQRVRVTSRIDDRTGYDISWRNPETGKTCYAQVKTSTIHSPSLSSWRISASQIKAHENIQSENHEFFYVFLYAYNPKAKLSNYKDPSSEKFRALGFILKPEDLLFHPHTIYVNILSHPLDRLTLNMHKFSEESSLAIRETQLQKNYGNRNAKPDFATAIQTAATVMNHGLFIVAKYLEEEQQLGKIRDLEINYSKFSPSHPNFSFTEIPSGKKILVEFKASTGKAPAFKDKDTLKTPTSIKMTETRLRFINEFQEKYAKDKTSFQIWKAYFDDKGEMILDRYDFSHGIDSESKKVSLKPWEYRITLRTGDNDSKAPKIGNFMITDKHQLRYFS